MSATESRVAVISIIVEPGADIAAINDLLHEATDYIIGRMGIPYRARNINIISVAIDAPQDVTSALSGRLGNLEHVTSKTAYSSMGSEA